MIAVLLLSSAHAEEKADLGAQQRLKPDTIIRVDILDPATETMHWDASYVDPITLLSVPLDVDVLDPVGTFLGTSPSPSDITVANGVGAYQLLPDDVDPNVDGTDEPLEEWLITVEDGLGVPIDRTYQAGEKRAASRPPLNCNPPPLCHATQSQNLS